VESNEKPMTQTEDWPSIVTLALPVALYTADAKNFTGPRIVGDGLAALLGFKAEDFAKDAMLWLDRIHPDDRRLVLARDASPGDTGLRAIEYRWRAADGSERIFLDSGALVAGPGGTAQIRGVCLDVTEQRRGERQARQSQKSAAIGRLTGGIAHEINNLLTVIMWNLDLMTRSLGGGSKDFDRAHIALSAAMNGTGMLQRLMAFSHHQLDDAQAIELNEFLPRTVQLLKPVIGADIAVNYKLAPGTWPVLADPTQLELALINLAIHAREAMPEGGALTIEATNLPSGAVAWTKNPADAVMLTLSGIGSVADQRRGAAEAKSSDSGPLAMVTAFVEDSGGTLKLDKNPSGDISARLALPRADTARTGASNGNTAHPAGQGGHIVLVVEDDADVRSVTVARLQELGHRVLEVDNAKAALAILGQDTPIDLLFTDIAMPGGMNGLELARRAQQLRPDMKVIFVSGYTSAIHTEGGVGGEFLQKPYRFEQLDKALKRVLDTPGH
jgi:CheY-like chemotaxis protein